MSKSSILVYSYYHDKNKHDGRLMSRQAPLLVLQLENMLYSNDIWEFSRDFFNYIKLKSMSPTVRHLKCIFGIFEVEVTTVEDLTWRNQCWMRRKKKTSSIKKLCDGFSKITYNKLIPLSSESSKAQIHVQPTHLRIKKKTSTKWTRIHVKWKWIFPFSTKKKSCE